MFMFLGFYGFMVVWFHVFMVHGVMVLLFYDFLVKKNEWNFGKVMGLFRLSLVGDLSGPDLFSIVSLLGKETCNTRMMLLSNALEKQ